MKKFLMLCIILQAVVATSLWAQAQYHVKQLPAGSVPTIDGDITEWPVDYFVDSLNNDSNVYARDQLTEWQNTEFQMYVYVAFDATKVYLAIKVTADLVVNLGSGWTSDNMKINPGGQAAAFYIHSDGSGITRNPSSPYQEGTSLWAAALPTGNGSFPTYECALAREIQDPFTMGLFSSSFGSEDFQAGTNQIFAAIGAKYNGNKQDWSSNPWDNPLYYPTFTLDGAEGPPVGIDHSVQAGIISGSLTASPNPFRPATTLSYHAKRNGAIKVYDLSGKVIKSFAIKAGSGKVSWNAEGLASGIYIARMTCGTQVFNTRLFLTK